MFSYYRRISLTFLLAWVQEKKLNILSLASGKPVRCFKPEGDVGEPIKVQYPSCVANFIKDWYGFRSSTRIEAFDYLAVVEDIACVVWNSHIVTD